MEDQLGYPRSVYFYAGRACPDYGQAALAFSPSSEQDRVHSATPFGTGGVLRKDIQNAFSLNLQSDGLVERVAFCTASTIQGDRWRSEFADWLACYYPTDPNGYWTRKPETPEPERLYTSNENWQAWTWEVRFHEGPDVCDAVRWAADSAQLNQIRNELVHASLEPAEETRLTEFMRKILNEAGSPTFCEDLEQWVQKQCT